TTKRACERHRLDPACTRRAECARCRCRGGSGRVDVVDHGDFSRCCRARTKGATDCSALDGRAAALAPAARPFEQRQAGGVPKLGELWRGPLRRVVSPLEASATVGRDERERVDLGYGKPHCDELRDLGGEPPQATFLPRVDEPSRGRVVSDRSAGTREGETPAGTL